MSRSLRWSLGILLLLGTAVALRAGLVAFAGYVLLGVFLLSRFLAKSWITALTAEREVDNAPREIGDSAEVVVRVTNAGKLPVAWLLVEDSVPDHTFAKRGRLSVKGSRLKVLVLGSAVTKTLKYKLTFLSRGYFQVGPLFVETGDVFGLHRRHRVLTEPAYVLVYPKVLSLTQFDFASSRPIGEIRLANRLFEDPTRSAGVRPYQMGDPLQRVHWRATARTGQLHSRVYEPTSLAGATLLLDFHIAGYPNRGEPVRSELAITIAASIANAVVLLNQQVGFASNGRDATERIRDESLSNDKLADAEAKAFETRHAAREPFDPKTENDRLRPVVVETRRGFDQFQRIRETLARLELTDGRAFADMLLEVAPRLPRDATVIAILPRVPVETAVALGHLRRRGFAVSAILVGLADDGSDDRNQAYGRLVAEGVRDVRHINTEAQLMSLGDRAAAPVPSEYLVSTPLV